MTEDSDEDNPASVSAAFIDRITASLRRLGTTVEVAPEEAAHHPAGTGGAVSLAAAADSAETVSAAPGTESSIIQCPVCLDSLSEIKSRGKISELYILSSPYHLQTGVWSPRCVATCSASRVWPRVSTAAAAAPRAGRGWGLGSTTPSTSTKMDIFNNCCPKCPSNRIYFVKCQQFEINLMCIIIL